MTEQKRKEKKWSLLYCPGDEVRDAAIRNLSKEAGLSEIMARLLYTRGYRTAKDVQAFFYQETAFLHDPFLLQDIMPAVQRIEKALERIGEFVQDYIK